MLGTRHGECKEYYSFCNQIIKGNIQNGTVAFLPKITIQVTAFYSKLYREASNFEAPLATP